MAQRPHFVRRADEGIGERRVLALPDAGQHVFEHGVERLLALARRRGARDLGQNDEVRDEAALEGVAQRRHVRKGGIVPDFVVLAEISRTSPPREGEQPLDAVLEDVLAGIWERENTTLVDAFVGPPHEMWALRHALSEGVKHSGRLIAFDLSFRRGDIMRFLAHMKAEMPKRFEDVTICDFGHIGDGGVHFNLVVTKDDPRLADPGFEARLRDWVFKVTVEEFDGSYSAEHAIGRKNQVFYDRYTPEAIRRLAAGLKAITSPGPLGSVTF